MHRLVGAQWRLFKQDMTSTYFKIFIFQVLAILKIQEIPENVGPFALVAIPSIKALPFWLAILSDPFLVVSSLSVILMSTCLLTNDLTQAFDTFWSHSTTLDNILSDFDASKKLFSLGYVKQTKVNLQLQ